MSNRKLSVLIPLFNEEAFIETILNRVLDAPLPEHLEREVIVVNDCSVDSSAEVVARFLASHPNAPVRLLHHTVNQGKGAAIRTALKHAAGDFTIIQDADLEYDPAEYTRLLKPLLEGHADVVFGSRFLAAGERRVLYFWHSVANRLLTLACSVVTDLNLSDMETGYKAFRTSLIQSIPLRSQRFGFEPEITIKVARRNARVYETPITYHGRTYAEGKKIGWPDALEALWIVLKSSRTNDLYTNPCHEILAILAQAQRFNRWMADTIAPYVGERVLEIGAGIGSLSRELAHGRQYYAATDIDREHLAALSSRSAQLKLDVKRCNLADAADMKQFKDKINTILCLNVLEHVANAPAAALNMYDTLPHGGKAIVLVPHDQRVYGKLDEALGHHLRYSQEQLRAVLENAGFRVDRILEFNRISRPGWYLTGKVLQRTTLSRFALKSFDRLVWLWRKIDRRLPWPPTSIIAIAFKD